MIEVIGVELREDGSREITRNFDQVAASAEKADSAVGQLQSALSAVQARPDNGSLNKAFIELKGLAENTKNTVVSLKNELNSLNKNGGPSEIAISIAKISTALENATVRAANLIKHMETLKAIKSDPGQGDLFSSPKSATPSPQLNLFATKNVPTPNREVYDTVGELTGRQRDLFQTPTGGIVIGVDQAMLSVQKLTKATWELEGVFKKVADHSDNFSKRITGSTFELEGVFKKKAATVVEGQQSLDFMSSAMSVKPQDNGQMNLVDQRAIRAMESQNTWLNDHLKGEQKVTEEQRKQIGLLEKQGELQLTLGQASGQRGLRKADMREMWKEQHDWDLRATQGSLGFMGALPTHQAPVGVLDKASVFEGLDKQAESYKQLGFQTEKLKNGTEQLKLPSREFAIFGTESAAVEGKLKNLDTEVRKKPGDFGAAGNAAKGAGNHFNNTSNVVTQFVRNLWFLQMALQMLAGFFFLRELKQYIDGWIGVTNSIKLSTSSAGESAVVQERLFNVAQKNRSTLDDTVTLYRRGALAASTLGASQEDLIKFTDAVGMSLAIQGTGADAAKGSLLQLGQMLGMGKVRMQEFNSISENTPRLLMGIVKHLDGLGNQSIVGLRKKLEEQSRHGGKIDWKGLILGKENDTIDAKDLFQALLKAIPELEAEFQRVTPTIQGSFNVLHNALEKAVGQFNETTHASDKFATAILWVTNHISGLASALAIFGAGAFVMSLPVVWTYLIKIIGVLNPVGGGAATGLIGLLLVNPLFTALALLAAVAAGLFIFRNSLALTSSSGVSLGDTLNAVFEKIGSWVSKIADVIKGWFGGTKEQIQGINGAVGAQQTIAAGSDGSQTLGLIGDSGRKGGYRAAETALLEDTPYKDLIDKYSKERDISAAFTASIMERESDFNPNALSHLQKWDKDLEKYVFKLDALGNKIPAARGLMQIMPGTADQLGLDRKDMYDPEKNIQAGVKYLDQIMKRFGGDLQKTSSGYNAGPYGAVLNQGKPYDDVKNDLPHETVDYTKAVTGFYQGHLGGSGQTNAPAAIQAAVVNPVPEVSRLQDAFSSLGNYLTGLKDIIYQAVNELIGIFNFLSEAIPIALAKLPNAIFELFANAMNGAIDLVNGGYNVIIGVFNKLGGHFKKAHLVHVQVDAKGAGEDLSKTLEDSLKKSLSRDYLTEALKGIQGSAFGRLNASLFGAIQKQIDGVKNRAGEIAKARHEGELKPDTRGLDKKPDPLAIPFDRTAWEEKVRQLEDTIDPIGAAFRKQADDLNLFAQALKNDVIGQTEFNLLQAATEEHFKSAIYPFQTYLDGIDEEIKVLELDTNERKANLELLQAEKKLKKQGYTPDPNEKRDALARLERRNDLKLEAAEYDRLKNKIKKPYEDAAIAVKVLDRLLKEKKINASQYASELAEVNISAGLGSWTDGFITQLDVLSAKATNWAAHLGKIFGTVVTSVSSSIGDAVSKIIVYGGDLGQMLGDLSRTILATLISSLVQVGIQLLLNAAISAATTEATTVATLSASGIAAAGNVAIAEVAGPLIAEAYAPAAALVEIATFGGASLAAIGGLATTVAASKLLASGGALLAEKGGYTGNGPTNQIAGMFHGQEYVLNASATKKFRPILEAMNSGRYSGATATGHSSSGSPMNVQIHNYTPANIQVEQISPTEIRVIAREEAVRAVHKHGPSIIAGDVSNPNGRVSQAIALNTTASRKR
jgi:tape measure domain-containing protein